MIQFGVISSSSSQYMNWARANSLHMKRLKRICNKGDIKGVPPSVPIVCVGTWWLLDGVDDLLQTLQQRGHSIIGGTKHEKAK